MVIADGLASRYQAICDHHADLYWSIWSHSMWGWWRVPSLYYDAVTQPYYNDNMPAAMWHDMMYIPHHQSHSTAHYHPTHILFFFPAPGSWSRVHLTKEVIGPINRLVQERCNSSALAMELRLSCTNPSIFSWQAVQIIFEHLISKFLMLPYVSFVLQTFQVPVTYFRDPNQNLICNHSCQIGTLT